MPRFLVVKRSPQNSHLHHDPTHCQYMCFSKVSHTLALPSSSIGRLVPLRAFMQIINQHASSQHDKRRNNTVSLPVRNLQLPIMTWEIDGGLDGGREGAGDKESSNVRSQPRSALTATDNIFTRWLNRIEAGLFSRCHSECVSFEFY